MVAVPVPYPPPTRFDRRTYIASTLVLSLLPLGGAVVAQSDADANETVDLESTEWQLSRMAARGPWDMTIGFGPDGVLTATTPCFEVTGRYATEGDEIGIEAVKVEGSGGDDAACDIVQEAGGDVLLQALGDAQRWSIDAERVLGIEPASGTTDHELSLEPLAVPGPADGPAPGSYSGSWELVEIIAQSGEPSPLPEGLVITLELDEAGVVKGSAGCSEYAGTYAVDESALLEIADLAVDEIGDCDPLFSRWQQDYLRLVESVDESARDGDELVLGTDPRGFDLYFEVAG